MNQTRWSNGQDAEKSRDTKLKKCYSITAKQYDEWSATNDNSCHICNKPETIKDKRNNLPRNLAVDHDSNHPDGLVRGLLCSKCNRALGMFNHNPELLQEAAKYLEYFYNVTVPGVAHAIDSL